ncbi:hypothetical protein OHB00_11805 [Streptomyces sp. NBC_00631]|uniref:hypothetical protein n=1 Tax=Streptomyces sp. NBC_00631 TaxID=2975793 RepID=UPI0030E4D53E
MFPDRDNQIRGCVPRLRALGGTDPDAYYAEPGTPDHDAMVLLDMLGTPHAPTRPGGTGP